MTRAPTSTPRPPASPPTSVESPARVLAQAVPKRTRRLALRKKWAIIGDTALARQSLVAAAPIAKAHKRQNHRRARLASGGQRAREPGFFPGSADTTWC